MDRQNYRRRIYDGYASSFREVGREFNAVAAKRWGKSYDYYFRNWLPQRKDAAILDLACGSGELLYFFKQRGYTNLAGVDISPEQIGIARQVTPDVTEGDVLDFLMEHSNSFDLIAGLDIIEHLRKEEVLIFFERCYGASKPGARIILQTPNAASPWAPSVRYSDFTHEVCFTPNLLMKLLSMSGFDELAAREACPPPWGYSLASSIRCLIWQCIRGSLMLYSIVETGGTGNGVFTRVFMVSGVKKQTEKPITYR